MGTWSGRERGQGSFRVGPKVSGATHSVASKGTRPNAENDAKIYLYHFGGSLI